MRPLRRTGYALVIMMMAAAVPAMAAAPAAADPGFCGVRSDLYQAGGRISYVVRNKCAQSVNLDVFLPEIGTLAYPGCQAVAGGRYGYYSHNWADRGWQVRAC
ncbi:MAG: hypothetical protein ACT4RN_13220 [Pseudonocardia sp.]